MRRRIKAVATEMDAGRSLIDLLAQRYSFRNREQWLETISDRQVMVNGRAGAISLILKQDDEVLYEAPEAPEPPVNINISLLFEDEDLLVINKSGNLPCHPAGAYYENTLWFQVKQKFGLIKPHLINRLDRETSGVVLVAKNSKVAKKLSDQFLKHRVEKFYSVVVEGDFPEKSETGGWLMTDGFSAVRKKRRFISGAQNEKPSEKAEWAESRFSLIDQINGLSFLRVELLTGRLHQIRATLCSLGFPVVGDKLYGVDDNLFIRFINDRLSADDKIKLRMDRQALHAECLHLHHPASGEPICFTAPLPDDISAMLSTTLRVA